MQAGVVTRDDLVRGYAEALFSVAEAEAALDAGEDELFRFARTLERSTELRQSLTDPALPPERRRAVIQDLLTERANPVTVNVLGFLVEQGRVRDLPAIVDLLAALAAERR